MKQKWKLSTIEHMLDGNIVYFVRLEGRISLDQLRSALLRVQRKHPALRTLIREEKDGLYYESDSAPEIPVRIVPRLTVDDYRSECQTELTTSFTYDQPQIRVVWLPSDTESDLLLTTSHRICDGISVLIIVREILQSLCGGDELISYQPITTQHIIGNYKPPQPWKRQLMASLLNGMLRLIPHARQAPEYKEHFLEWRADQELSGRLKQWCKAQGVSVHACLLAVLERALFAVFGERLPKSIASQIDPRRGRFTAIKDDMVFFGGGGFKMRTAPSPEIDFWARVRSINEEIPKQVEQEVLNIRSRFHFIEMLRPLASGQVHSIMRLLYAMQFNRNNSFALSNLGNVVIGESDSPVRLKDLRLYVHSSQTRLLGLVTYTLNGEMRFYCVSDEKCMTRNQIEALQREFLAILQRQAMQPVNAPGEMSHVLIASAT